MSRRTFGNRVNEWLAEPKGQIFRQGKWRFWYPTLLSLTALNAFLTAVIFGNDAQKYIGPIVLLAGAVLCWLALGLLHYSDSEDRTLAMGVAILDSLSLLFVAAHFSFLVWVYGHAGFLRAAESKYQRDLAEYNAQWKPVAESNDRIAQTAERIAEIEKQTERLRNDTAYWSRKNKVQPSKSGIKVELSTTKVDLPDPPKAPADSSVEYLARWDAYVRLAGFGELALSIVTLIFVRTRTAARNRIAATSQPNADQGDAWPDEIDAGAPIRRRDQSNLRSDASDTGDATIATQSDPERPSVATQDGLAILRDTLSDVSFTSPGKWFKCDLKPSDLRPDHVFVRLNYRDGSGREVTERSCKLKLDVLTDAVRMPRDQFRARVERSLRRGGFEI